MPDQTPPGDDELLARYALTLADGVDAAIAGWVRSSVARIAEAWSGQVAPQLADAASAAGERARADVAPRVRALLEQDVDDQRSTPLALLREAVVYPTSVLEAAGIPPVQRDEMAESAFPEDLYDLSPATFADLDPDLAVPGLEWGAAKAHVVISRRRRG